MYKIKLNWLIIFSLIGCFNKKIKDVEIQEKFKPTGKVVHEDVKSEDDKLMDACAQGLLYPILESLFKVKSVNYTDRYGETPLLVACRHKPNFQKIQLLVDKGARFSQEQIQEAGNILLRYCNKGEFNTALKLAEAGAPIGKMAFNAICKQCAHKQIRGRLLAMINQDLKKAWRAELRLDEIALVNLAIERLEELD